MRRFIYGKTMKCCVCYETATNWSGWLIKSRDGIRAGFCKDHTPIDKSPNKMHGIYNKQMESNK